MWASVYIPCTRMLINCLKLLFLIGSIKCFIKELNARALLNPNPG